MKGKLFTKQHIDYFSDTGEEVGYSIKGYSIKGYEYHLLGEVTQLTKPEMPFIKVFHATIEKKCSKEVYHLYHNKTHKISMKLRILSVLEMILRKIVYNKKWKELQK